MTSQRSMPGGMRASALASTGELTPDDGEEQGVTLPPALSPESSASETGVSETGVSETGASEPLAAKRSSASERSVSSGPTPAQAPAARAEHRPSAVEGHLDSSVVEELTRRLPTSELVKIIKGALECGRRNVPFTESDLLRTMTFGSSSVPVRQPSRPRSPRS
jgi:hypothetical protein